MSKQDSRARVSSVVRNPSAFGEAAYELAAKSVHTGVMMKQSKKIGMVWRKRFCVLLTDGILYYFNQPTDKESLSKVDLRDITMLAETNKPKKNGIRMDIQGRSFYFACETDEDRKQWVSILNISMVAVKTGLPLKPKKAAEASTPEPANAASSSTTVSSPTNLQRVDSATSKKRHVTKAFSLSVGTLELDLRTRISPWTEWACEFMRCGLTLHKYPYLGLGSGKPKKRFFQLTSDYKEIRWGAEKSPDNSFSLTRRLPVRFIEQVIYGPYTLTWTKFYPKVKAKWKCVSLVVNFPSKREGKTKKRTIDLHFQGETETLAWLIGLVFLTGTHRKSVQSDLELNMVMSSYKWTKLKLQVIEKADAKQISTGKVVAEAINEQYG